ncbi:MAG: galactose-1-phosphate uridylyltransferase [Bacteroidales bacterium]
MGNWERRWHPLLQEWVILAATTADRPWSGAVIEAKSNDEPVHDPGCYLCPGVTRASGEKNPDYVKTFAFTNDFASFSLDAPDVHSDEIFERTEPVHGTCRVICFSPLHNITMAELGQEEIEDIYSVWRQEYENLSAESRIRHVLIFENKGKVIGVSNPHPHGQIYATGFVPRIAERQLESFSEYYKRHRRHLLSDILEREISQRKRVVLENEYFVAFIPFFARFVFETYIVPRRHVSRITDLSPEEMIALASIHRQLIIRFDNLYNISFPNITMLQNAPTEGNSNNDLFHFHVEFYPPMRAPDKLKYLAGFESGGGNIINPVMPETAAAMLREVRDTHYKRQL